MCQTIMSELPIWMFQEETQEYLEEAKLKELVEKYSEFINFPIYLYASKEVDVPADEAEADESEVSDEDEEVADDDEDVEDGESSISASVQLRRLTESSTLLLPWVCQSSKLFCRLLSRAYAMTPTTKHMSPEQWSASSAAFTPLHRSSRNKLTHSLARMMRFVFYVHALLFGS